MQPTPAPSVHVVALRAARGRRCSRSGGGRAGARGRGRRRRRWGHRGRAARVGHGAHPPARDRRAGDGSTVRQGGEDRVVGSRVWQGGRRGAVRAGPLRPAGSATLARHGGHQCRVAEVRARVDISPLRGRRRLLRVREGRARPAARSLAGATRRAGRAGNGASARAAPGNSPVTTTRAWRPASRHSVAAETPPAPGPEGDLHQFGSETRDRPAVVRGVLVQRRRVHALQRRLQRREHRHGDDGERGQRRGVDPGASAGLEYCSAA